MPGLPRSPCGWAYSAGSAHGVPVHGGGGGEQCLRAWSKLHMGIREPHARVSPLRERTPCPCRACGGVAELLGQRSSCVATAGESGLLRFPAVAAALLSRGLRTAALKQACLFSPPALLSRCLAERRHLPTLAQARSPCGPAFSLFVSSVDAENLIRQAALSCRGLGPREPPNRFSGSAAAVLLQTPLPRACWGSGGRHLLRTRWLSAHLGIGEGPRSLPRV